MVRQGVNSALYATAIVVAVFFVAALAFDPCRTGTRKSGYQCKADLKKICGEGTWGDDETTTCQEQGNMRIRLFPP